MSLPNALEATIAKNTVTPSSHKVSLIARPRQSSGKIGSVIGEIRSTDLIASFEKNSGVNSI